MKKLWMGAGETMRSPPLLLICGATLFSSLFKSSQKSQVSLLWYLTFFTIAKGVGARFHSGWIGTCIVLSHISSPEGFSRVQFVDVITTWVK